MEAKDWDQVANKYFEEIGSPFAKGVDNKLFKSLAHIAKHQNKSVLDLGCGIGNLLPFLSKTFKKVVGLDFSSAMLKIARKRCKSLNNITILKGDMRNLKQFYSKFDVVTAINSILMPSIEDINIIFSELYNVLKQKGRFIGIFPSIESDLYRAMLTYEREFIESKSARTAKKNTHIIIGKDTYDFLLGIFNNKGKQKHYYCFELKYRLKNAGFKNIKISKLHYPWQHCVDDDINFFQGKPQLWDWLVSAHS